MSLASNAWNIHAHPFHRQVSTSLSRRPAWIRPPLRNPFSPPASAIVSLLWILTSCSYEQIVLSRDSQQVKEWHADTKRDMQDKHDGLRFLPQAGTVPGRAMRWDIRVVWVQDRVQEVQGQSVPGLPWGVKMPQLLWLQYKLLLRLDQADMWANNKKRIALSIIRLLWEVFSLQIR